MIVATHIVTPGKFIISCHMMVHLGAFIVGLHSQIHLEPQSALEEFRQQSTCSSVKGASQIARKPSCGWEKLGSSFALNHGCPYQ